VKRLLTGVSELLKPISFFLIGAWLLLHLLDQKTQTSPLMGKKLLFLSFTAAVVVAESLLDILLMLQIAPGTLVSCCTTVTDILERPTRLFPQAAVGPRYEFLLGTVYYGGNIVLMILLVVAMRRVKAVSSPGGRRLLGGALFLCAVLNAALFVLTQVEVHAPRIMGLPFHHCLYCLWQYVPDAILMYLLFVLGTSAVGWAFILDFFARTGETAGALSAFMRALYGFSVFCLAASLVMNTVHLLAA